MWDKKDYQFMAHALQLAKRGRHTDPNPRVGCVLVVEDKIIGQGWHDKCGEAHAEIKALKDAHPNTAHTAYITLEPCCHHGQTPPCVERLIDHRIKKVIVAMIDANPLVAGKSLDILKQAGIESEHGLLQDQAHQLNLGFSKRMATGMPYVRCKLASTLDGRTALANGKSQWITDQAARHDVQKLRARSSAIITGVNTILADDAKLTVRDITMTKQPLRVILDRTLRTPKTATCLQLEGNTVIYTTLNDAQKKAALTTEKVKVESISPTDERSFIVQVLQHLAQHYTINEVLVEAGAKLSGAFIQERMIDELICYMSPKLFGHHGNALCELDNIEEVDLAHHFRWSDVCHVGNDLRLVARPRY